jgi:hypothetical protein
VDLGETAPKAVCFEVRAGEMPAGGRRRSKTASTDLFEPAHVHVMTARELERVSGAP